MIGRAMPRLPRCLALFVVLGFATPGMAAPRGKRARAPKVYTPPELEPEPAPEPAADVASVEIREDELPILARPERSPRLGAALRGARLPIRGQLDAGKGGGCASKRWYALKPEGWICGAGVRPTKEPPDARPALHVEKGERVPFHYRHVLVGEGQSIPLYLSRADAEAKVEPWRKLERGDSLAVESTVTVHGEPHLVLVDGLVMPQKGTSDMDSASGWQGVEVGDKVTLPFGWVTRDEARIYAEPDAKSKVVGTIDRRERVPLLEDREVEKVAEPEGAKKKSKKKSGPKRFVRIGEGRWLESGDVNEVRLAARPAGTEGNDRWIDVDLGEQVLVAYEKERPVYATLVSSGRTLPTPRGTYRIWAKAATTNMKSQAYEDKEYFVHKVPWVLFFQAHNAIHAAYWHDRFGQKKSHGCVNVAPLDARHLFEWATPALPDGWHGVRPVDLLRSIAVYIRDSHKSPAWVQDRPIGPPDKEEEKKKLEDAEKRRAAAADDAEKARGAAGAAGAAAPAVPAKP